jgi:CheY-like chemotaxis protein
MARESVECPQCGKQTDVSEKNCENCGVSLKWALGHSTQYWSAPPASRPPLILHVDDDSSVLAWIGVMLECAGYRATRARDTVIAFELARRFTPDLIITDIMVPGMAGIELIAQLKADPVLQDIPVVVLSAHGDDETVAAAMEAGAVLYLRTPILHQELVSAVASVLSDKRLPVVLFPYGRIPEAVRVALGNKGYQALTPIKTSDMGEDAACVCAGRWLNTPLKPDVIAFKFHYDELEGLDALAYLKSIPSVRHIPVVMLAEEPEPELEQRAMALGASAVYAGPLDAEKLAEVFRTVMEE